MPPEIVDLNDYQVSEWPTTPDGEARQANEVEAHYRTLLGHPAVAGDDLVGLPRRRLADAPSGLVRADGSPKPAYERLRGLVKGEWWLAPTTMRTDELGRIRLSAVPRRLRGHIARPGGRVLHRCPRIGRGGRDPELMTGASRRPSVCRVASVSGC